jgi:hypothetical protein
MRPTRASARLKASQQPLVEAAGPLERLPRAERAASRGNAEEPIQRQQAPYEDMPIQGQLPVEADRAAAADRSAGQGRKCRCNDRRRDQRVGIDKEEDIAGGGLGSRIAGAGNLPVVDGDDSRAVLGSNCRRAIGGAVIRDDDLKRLAAGPRGGIDRIERPPQQQLFVVGRNDEGDHGGIVG